MKFLIVFALAVATASAFDLRVVQVAEPEGRITHGHDATAGQFPYQVGLLLKFGSYSKWCGGSLIGQQWVLTSARCTDGVESVIVYLGAIFRTSPEVIYQVTKKDIIIHADWDIRGSLNDISLIKIPSVTYSNNIKAVKLPALAETNETYVGDKAIASGWGVTSDDSDALALKLQWATMKVISNRNCQHDFKSEGYDTLSSYIVSSKICASTASQASTCDGDAGSPLVLQSNNVQVGVTSYTPCEAGLPAIFTRVTSYLDWIKAYTGISY